jgi:hypothetical protein
MTHQQRPAGRRPVRIVAVNVAVYAAAAAAVVAGLAGVGQAGIVLSSSDTLFTTTVAQTAPLGSGNANRGVNNARSTAQTFQLAGATLADAFVIVYNSAAANVAFDVRLVTVADVNAATFTPTSVLAQATLNSGTTLSNSGTSRSLVLDFTGADEQVLAASTGTAGYALQVIPDAGFAGVLFNWRIRNDNPFAFGRLVESGASVAGQDGLLAIVPEPAALAVAASAAGLLRRRRRA